MSKEIMVTEEGLKKLQEELHYLKTVKRKEVVEAILSCARLWRFVRKQRVRRGKKRTGQNRARIQELEETLKNVKLISDSELHTESSERRQSGQSFQRKF